MHPKHRKRIDAGLRCILEELKPSKAQVERGLALHAESFVADAQGGVPVTTPVDLIMDRLEPELEQIKKDLEARGLDEKDRRERLIIEWKRRKTFESAFDPQWRAAFRKLYRIAGVNMGAEDVAGPNENTFEQALVHIARNGFVHERTGDVIRVGHAEDIERARRQGKPCVVQHLAGVGAFAESEDPIRYIDLFFALGVRMMQLTYIQKNKLCCSWMQSEDTGLTALGRQAVRRMNELGVMVDIAHCGDRSSFDVIEASAEPVLVSHTACRAVYDDASNPFYLDAVTSQDYARGVERPAKTGSRNISDEIMRAVAARDGIVALYTIDYMLGRGKEGRSFDAFARHLEHAVEIAGVDHVAIGSDRTYFPTWEPESMDWTNWPYWTVGLVCRGFDDEDVRKIIGANYLRYAERVLDKRPWGAFI